MTDTTTTATRRFGRGFWGVILLGIAVVMLASIVAAIRGPARHEIPPGVLNTIASEAAQEAVEVVTTKLDPALDRLFKPVRAAIPAYADFHYSVLGEYTELANAAMGQSTQAIQNTMFAGFEAHLTAEMARLDEDLGIAYRHALEKRLIKLRAELEDPDIEFGPMTQQAIAEAPKRFVATLPVGLVASAAVSGGAAKVASAAIAKKLVAKIGAKTAVKAGGKLAATMGGAGAGALACAWAGPGAVLCGAAAAAATWFTVDAAIITIDENINRKKFETEMQAMVDAVRTDLRARIITALTAKTVAFDQSTATLREQAAP